MHGVAWGINGIVTSGMIMWPKNLQNHGLFLKPSLNHCGVLFLEDVLKRQESENLTFIMVMISNYLWVYHIRKLLAHLN